MTHEEQRIWLINKLLAEKEEYSNTKIPDDEGEQKDLLRALMNVRMPEPVSEEFLKIQDEYLCFENEKAGVVDIAELEPISEGSQLYLWQGDITRLKVDAITNPANSAMLGCFIPLHNCVDNIIGSKAGIQLRLACNEYMERQAAAHGGEYEEPTGKAMITFAYNLPSRYILHTVGPIVQGPLTKEHEDLLASCYISCLELAEEKKLASVAFCCISTGVFMFPNQRAAEIAVETVRNWLDKKGSDMKIIFNVYKDQDLHIYRRLLQ